MIYQLLLKIKYDDNHKYIFEDIMKFKQLLNSYKRTIDTRNTRSFDKINKHIEIYRNLKNYLSKVYNAGDPYVTNSWEKMYEMLEKLKLIPKRKKRNYTTFNFCEANPWIISAINHFIKTKTK